jgi:hypothetical protein
MSKRVPIWQELEKLSPKKLDKRVGEHRQKLHSFEIATEHSIKTLTKLSRDIDRVQNRITKSLENDNMAEAITEILMIRKLRIEEMVELSALSILRSNRFYNKLVLDVSKGIQSGVKYDAESIEKMVPEDMKSTISTSITSTDFYDILTKYKGKLNEFIKPDSEEGDE